MYVCVFMHAYVTSWIPCFAFHKISHSGRFGRSQLFDLRCTLRNIQSYVNGGTCIVYSVLIIHIYAPAFCNTWNFGECRKSAVFVCVQFALVVQTKSLNSARAFQNNTHRIHLCSLSVSFFSSFFVYSARGLLRIFLRLNWSLL